MDFYSPILKTLFKEEIPFEPRPDLVDTFYQILSDTNQHINLTRIVDRADFDWRHILDSWALFLALPNTEKLNVYDLGTGGGIPGIPLWLVKPHWNYTLIDSVGKKLKAIGQMCGQLQAQYPEHLPHCPETVNGRAEELGQSPRYRAQADVVVSRALAPLSTLLEYCAPFVKKGGHLIAMKGPAYKEELKSAKKAAQILGADLEEVIPYTLNGREFYLLKYKKTQKTPGTYPRAVGVPKKSPLG